MINKLGRSLLSIGIAIGLMAAVGPSLAGYGSYGQSGYGNGGYGHGGSQDGYSGSDRGYGKGGYSRGGYGGKSWHRGGKKCKWVGGHWRNGQWVRPQRVCWGGGHRR